MAGDPLEPTALHRVDPDGHVTQVADDLWFPNGSVITPDHLLVVVETFGNRVTAFDLTDGGELTNRAATGPVDGAYPRSYCCRIVDQLSHDTATRGWRQVSSPAPPAADLLAETLAAEWDPRQIGTLVYLLSPASSFLTGQVIYLDGGYTAC
jgi:hypothetical protein